MEARWSFSFWRCALTLAALVALAAPAHSKSRRLAALTGWDAAAVDRARDGAARKLQDPECQKLFTDFTDAEGRTLRENLAKWQMSPDEYLEIIPFVDGSRETLCRSAKVALVATPDVRRVVVCPAFASFQLKEPRMAESMIIHEILHTLGLGENPPTSIEITQRVESRCR